MRIDLSSIINWVLTIVLIMSIVFAVRQGYFEERKCINWVENKVFSSNGGLEVGNQKCKVVCENVDYNANSLFDENGILEGGSLK